MVQCRVCIAEVMSPRGCMDILNKDWVLLDSSSTVVCICIAGLIKQAHNCALVQAFYIYISWGHHDYKQEGHMHSLSFKVLFDLDSVSNILYLRMWQKLLCITMDTRKEGVMLVHTRNERVMKFRDCGDVLHYFDTSSHENPTNNRVSNYYSLSTVAKKTYFMHNKIEGADIVRYLQQTIGWTYDQKFKNMVVRIN